MSIIRVNKNKNYTTMSNYHFRDNRLSLKAKGLLSEMLSLPDDWDYSISGLVAINKENETSIKSTLDELKKYGYLVVNKLLPNKTETGRIEYVYDIYEKPKQEGEKQGVENLGVEFLGVENQAVENQGQINTNNKLTNNKINNNKNTNNIKSNYEKEFELIWSKYPNKKGKDDAKKYFIKARKEGITYDTIDKGLDNYIAYVKLNKIEVRFIAHGSTWMHQRRWNDEYTGKDVNVSSIITNTKEYQDMLKEGLIK